MKKILSLIASLMLASNIAHAGTVILTTSHIDVKSNNLVFYDDMMVKTNLDEQFPRTLTSLDNPSASEYLHPSQTYQNVSNFTINWIGLNSIDLKTLTQIDLTDCSFNLGANEIKKINIFISGRIAGFDDGRTAVCQIISPSL